MEAIQHFDQYVFQFINGDLSNRFFDYYLPILRSKEIWIPVYVFILSTVIFKFKKESWKYILVIITTVGMADATSSHVIKKNVQRIRPCNTIELNVVERVECGSGYSFTSSHAANHFALSFILILLFARKRKPLIVLLLMWAFIVAFAQVYVGVHYPLDIVAGGVLGIVLAISAYKIFQFLVPNKEISV